MNAGPSGDPPGQQLFLDFPRLDPAQRPVIETGPYRSIVGMLRRWKSWPEGQLAIAGEAFSGKTRLLRLWAADAGAAFVTGEALARADIDDISGLAITALAVDDADLSGADPERAGLNLLAALNLCRNRGAPVLLSGATEPGGWFEAPPDLKSRLKAMPVANVGQPDDETLGLRLSEECARRHLNIPYESVIYLATRMERTWESIGRVADQVERTPGRASSLRSARAVLVALGVDPG
jgi:chromosomal replication initiation ATPase DnaA